MIGFDKVIPSGDRFDDTWCFIRTYFLGLLTRGEILRNAADVITTGSVVFSPRIPNDCLIDLGAWIRAFSWSRACRPVSPC
jgi:hypothetical protein